LVCFFLKFNSYLKLCHPLFFSEPFKIWFQPTNHLGNYRYFSNFVFFFINLDHILEIFSLVDGQTAIHDPFTSINTNYVKNVSGRANCFLSDTEPYENPDNEEKVDHQLTVTLLPHQILIFPTTIFDNMDPTVLDEMRHYQNRELRYESK